MTPPPAPSTRELCAVYGCDEPAEVELIWEANTCTRLGWTDVVDRMRRYCRRCFDSKKMRHPWESADIVRPLAHNTGATS